MAACIEIRAGALHDQFVVDQIQGGAGTSTNMNANEVIANRALELLGATRGDYGRLHPNEHVNMGQSTNDVYPTALKIAGIGAIRRLVDAMAALRGSFAAKAEEFHDVLKMGRTQLQDAVPMTLGQEFGTYARMLAEDEARLGEAELLIREINLGATAIGTGITAHPLYAGLVRERLSAITEIPLITAEDWWKPPRIAAPSCRSRACSSASPSSCRRPATTCACSRAGRGRASRDQPAGAPGGILDHARQGQPGDPGGRQPGRLRGDRQRRDDLLRGGGRPAPAQRLRER